jgi:VanZ family protein
LLLGHAPDGQEEWQGDLLGLAFYPRALSGGEVAAHVQAWRESNTAALAKDAAALYAFDERAGGTVHDRAKNGDDLVIPRRFRVLHNTPLEVPAHPSMSDVQDAAVNILGFIPFGFLVAAYWQQAANYSRSRAVALTVVLGLATSLLIELLQVYVPSRDSSLLDVINNTIGSAVGALFPASILRWRAFSKLRLG